MAAIDTGAVDVEEALDYAQTAMKGRRVVHLAHDVVTAPRSARA